jgi:diguanylate cyclase (GGDEF)-like protein
VRSHARARQAPRRWLAYLVGGAVAVAMYLALPTGGALQGVLFTLLAGSTTAALVTGVVLHEPAARLGWMLLAAGQLLSAIGDAVDFVRPGAVWADACYLGMYVLITAALVVFVRRRTPGWDAATLIDAAVLAIGTGVIWWLYLIVPLTEDRHADAMAVAIPAMDLLVLVVALRLVLGAGTRTAAYRLLVAALLLMLCADVLYAVRSADGSRADGSWVDALRLASYLALGASALHPSMRWLDSRAASATPDAGPVRLGLLVTGALLPVFVLGAHRDLTPDHLAIVVTCTTAMFLLVVARLLGLAGTERQRAITDPLTGLYAEGVFHANLALEGQRAARNDGYLGVVLLEVDHFPLIAETYGQPAGDRVLCELANRLRGLCRGGDLVARIAPDRFGILLPGVDPYDCGRFAESVRAAVCERTVRLRAGTAVRVTVTVGVAVLPPDAPGPAHLLLVAEQAVEAAVTAGRNRTYNWQGQVHHPEPDIRA